MNRSEPSPAQPPPPKPAGSKKEKTALDLGSSEEDPTQIEKLGKAGLRNLPPALISFIFHLILIIAIALIYIPGQGNGRFSLSLETESATEEFDQIFEISAEEDFSPEVVSDQIEVSPSEAMESFEPELVEMESAAPELLTPVSNAGVALSGRGEQSRQGLLSRFGGTPETENAVELGLQWLARNQRKDGSWSLKGPYESFVAEDNIMAATGMALLAFLGHGETHQQGKYQRVVEKGINYLLANQSGNGHFVDRTAGFSHRLYTHAICSLCVCELLTLSQDENLTSPAQKAIDFAIEAQGPQGGWRYANKEGQSDLSVTGWFVMLFQSAKYAGLSFDPALLEQTEKFVDSMMEPEGDRFRYKADREPTLTMTAEGLLCRQYLGWKKDDSRLQAGARYLAKNPIRWSQKNVYYWYYATQVMRNMEDETWILWNEHLKTVLTERQLKTGRDKGSWDHTKDTYGGVAGKLYVTCLCIYSLEVYYRYLPLYQNKK